MVSIEWIDKQLIFLTSRLGVYRVDAGQDFFFEPTGGFYGFISQGRVEPLNEAITMLARHISSRSIPIIEDWKGTTDFLTTSDHDFASDTEIPGLINYDSPFRSRISIGFLNKHSPFILGAIIAHELTHHYLFSKNIVLPDNDENEKLTDLATAYLGLGKLTINGYEPVSWTVKKADKQITYTYKIGYLSTKEMALIIDKVCSFRNIPIEIAKKNLTDRASELLSSAHSVAVIEKKKKQAQIIKKEQKKIRKEKLVNIFKRIFPWLHRTARESERTISGSEDNR